MAVELSKWAEDLSREELMSLLKLWVEGATPGDHGARQRYWQHSRMEAALSALNEKADQATYHQIQALKESIAISSNAGESFDDVCERTGELDEIPQAIMDTVRVRYNVIQFLKLGGPERSSFGKHLDVNIRAEIEDIELGHEVVLASARAEKRLSEMGIPAVINEIEAMGTEEPSLMEILRVLKDAYNHLDLLEKDDFIEFLDCLDELKAWKETNTEISPSAGGGEDLAARSIERKETIMTDTNRELVRKGASASIGGRSSASTGTQKWQDQSGPVDAFYAEDGPFFAEGKIAPTMSDVIKAADGGFHDVTAFANALPKAMLDHFDFDSVVEFAARSTVITNPDVVEGIRDVYNIAIGLRHSAGRLESAHADFRNNIPDRGWDAIQELDGTKEHAVGAFAKPDGINRQTRKEYSQPFSNRMVLGNTLALCAESGMRWDQVCSELRSVGDLKFEKPGQALEAAAEYTAYAAVVTGAKLAPEKGTVIAADPEKQLSTIKRTLVGCVQDECQFERLDDGKTKAALAATVSAIDSSRDSKLPMAEMLESIRKVAPLGQVPEGIIKFVRDAWQDVVPNPVSQRDKKNLVEILVGDHKVDSTILVEALGHAVDQNFTGGQMVSDLRERLEGAGFDRLPGLRRGDMAQITGDLITLGRNAYKAAEQGQDQDRDAAIASTVGDTVEQWSMKATGARDASESGVSARA